MVLNMAFTKVHQSILQSSLWCEDSDTKVVWITLLALADKHGEVAGSIPGLARTAGVPLDRCQAAIAKFLSPDPFSRTPDNEGRRLEAIDGGWALVNYAKYRHEASKEDAKERNAKRQQRHRDKALLGVTRNGSSRSVTQNRDIAEAEAEAEAKKGENPPKPPPASPWHVAYGLDIPERLQTQQCLEAVKLWLKHKSEKREGYKPTGLTMALKKWANEFTPITFPAAVEASIANGWSGIFAAKANNQAADKPKPMWLQMKELEARIDTHPGNWNWLKYNAKTATKEQKDEYRALLKQLEAMQAGQEPLPMGEGDIP